MFYSQSIFRLLLISLHFVPAIATSEPITFSYFGRVNLTMVTPEFADFGCPHNSRPAKVVISDRTLGLIGASFQDDHLFSIADAADTSANTQVRITRGNRLMPLSKKDMRPDPFYNWDWAISIKGEMSFCASPETLKPINGNLSISGRIGQYEGEIVNTDNLLKDMQIRYDTYTQIYLKHCSFTQSKTVCRPT